MKLTETEKAYLAGIFDGEGCVGYYRRFTKGIPYHSASLHITSTDPRVINWIQDKVGYGNISMSVKSGNRKNAYSWQLCKQEHIQVVLEAIRPFLIIKGDQVDLLFSLWNDETHTKGHNSITTDMIIKRDELVKGMRSLKKLVVH